MQIPAKNGLWSSITKCAAGAKIPSPGGKVAPKGSEEECGRKPETEQNKADLHQCCHEDEALVEVFAFYD